MRSFIKQHRLASGLVAVSVLAGVAWLTFGYFAVQTLWIDDEVAEALPTFDQPAVVSTTASVASVVVTDSTMVDEAMTTELSTEDSMTEDSMTEDSMTEDSMTEDSMTEAASATTATATTTTSTTPPATTTTLPAPPEIITAYAGNFVTDSHQTTGVVSVLTNGTSQRFLRFEEFATDNGPDVNVYLVNSEAGGVSEFIDLGDMKGNIGDQNYEIPADIDLDVYDTVYLWCVRFSVSFAHAELMPT